VTRGVLHRRSHTPAHHDLSLSSLALSFRLLAYILSFISLLFKIARVHLFDTKKRFFVPRINNATIFHWLLEQVVNNLNIGKSISNPKRIYSQNAFLKMYCIVFENHAWNKVLWNILAIPVNARSLFSLVVTPCLAIKFTPHIIWLATDKILQEREGHIIYSANARESRCKRGRCNEIPSVERPREMSRAKVNAKSLSVINKSAKNYFRMILQFIRWCKGIFMHSRMTLRVIFELLTFKGSYNWDKYPQPWSCNLIKLNTRD